MKHTISILCDDVPGVMTRISGLFSRRGFNIESLSVGVTDNPGKSRFTIVVNGDDTVLEQLRKQLQKLINVINVWDYKEESIVSREHALLKVKAISSNRAELLQLVSSIPARIIDSSGDLWTLEITGDTEDVSSFIDLFRHYGIVESIRTGKIALKRG
ncbi:acetolactate synthase small subunit [Oceanispirochaeta crateris]|jgi:acetolactate synthase-1/3 small subunit|uniref:Acetolactate synthase small subunit n=1 Tax=Oceanispirochaeta crateris TaxID=2518645 RepID=A0A5C1QLI1_9SPIO|nr:acetolactate synthase small subunit [Oceanispirochaeta crateris]QEN07820.1 acetolactate synthase small subunit [Oceanispirochaeta crateris]